MDLVLNMLIGVGLAATCGFRAFVPFLVLGVAAMTGYIDLGSGFQWIGTYPAVIVFGVATLAEILAYLFPFVDNLLSVASAPVSMIAGTLITAAVMTDVSPLFQWSLAIIAGGGAATLSSLLSNGIHHGATVLSGGAANPVVSALESVLTVIVSVLAVLVPILAIAVLAFIIVFLYKYLIRLKRKLAEKAAMRKGI